MVKRLDGGESFVSQESAVFGAPWMGVWGILCGWLAIRFLAFSGGIEFLPPPSIEGIRNYCAKLGYPKHRDYFWYAAVLVSAWGGAGLAIGLKKLLRWSGWKGLFSRWIAPAGMVCLAGAFALSLPSASEVPLVPLVLAGLGFIFPWLDRRWMGEMQASDGESPYSPSKKRIVLWALIAVPVVFFVVRDPGMMWRNIDGMHEGAHLLYVQSAISGDMPGLIARTEYAPLYIHSLTAWMRMFGMTLSVERWYYQAVQMMGTFLQIFVLCWFLRNMAGAFIGFWVMLFLTIAPYTLYGATNSVRTAVPLAALVICWRGLEGRRPLFLAFSGALIGAAALYSQEYAATSLLACIVMIGAVMFRDGWRPVVRPFLAWAASGLAAYAFLMVVMFGFRAGDALSILLTGGYAVSRLSGHGARPFPAIPWIGDLPTLWKVHWTVFENAFLWFPAFLAGGVGAWLLVSGRKSLSGRRLLALGLTVAGLVSIVPALVRPLGNMAIAGTLIPMLALAALAVDWMWARGTAGRLGAVVIGGFLLVCGVTRLYIIEQDILKKWALVFTKAEVKDRLVPRFGRVVVNRAQEEGIAFLIKRIQEWCPPDKRIYMAAPGYNHILFLADRAGLPPYPTVSVAASPRARQEMVEVMEREKPPLALMTEMGVDIPFAEEHAEEWAYIQKHYTLAARAELLRMYVRKK